MSNKIALKKWCAVLYLTPWMIWITVDVLGCARCFHWSGWSRLPCPQEMEFLEQSEVLHESEPRELKLSTALYG
jgi:hypothetical protein